MTHGIKKLTDYEHARLKTEMYLGSRAKHTQEIIVYEDGKPVLKELTWVPALYTFFREILDNSVDEVIGHGFGNRIDVTYDEKTKKISVQDNGRGIPIDYDEAHKSYLATMVLTHARAGRNFDDRGEVAGTNGIGASICNFCSEEFVLEVNKDNKKFVQKFTENPFAGGKDLKVHKPKITDIKSEKTGTKITLKPSMQVFPDMILPEEFVKSRVYEVAVANPLLRVYYNGERLKVNPYTEKTLFPDVKPIIVDIKVDNLRTKFLLVPNFTKSGETIHSIVNNIPAFNGGVHIDSFRRQFYYNLLQTLEREGKRRKVMPNRADITEGLLIYNITQMKAPDFDSQSKTRLINEWVGKDIKNYLVDENMFKKLVKKHRDWIDLIFERAEARSSKRDDAEARKAARSAKRTKVGGLMDASGKKRKDCILFLAEGLCLEENTNIRILEDGSMIDKPIKDVQIGDTVITHNNRFREVKDKWSKVQQGLKIKTKNGKEVITSKEHKLFVCDIENKQFEFIKSIDLNPEKHKIVSSKLIEDYIFEKIIAVEKIDDPTFDVKIIYEQDEILSTLEHRFAIFDFLDNTFKMTSAKDIDIDNNVLLLIRPL